MLKDLLWERIKALLPVLESSPLGGRPRASDRNCWEAIIFVLRKGCRWRDIPAHLPSPATCWRRHRKWSAAESALLELVLSTIPEGVAWPSETPVIADGAYDSDPLREEVNKRFPFGAALLPPCTLLLG